MKRAWYLGHKADAVGDRAILVGDPGRVRRIAEHLENPEFLPVKRGLETLNGYFEGHKITVSAYGMGAPIATIVLHELSDLGITRFLRIGTAMYISPAEPGDLMISRDAIGFDGTSPAYLQSGSPYPANASLVKALQESATTNGQAFRVGRYATFDAFYRDMFGIDEEGLRQVDLNIRKLVRQSVLAIDMETSALLAAAKALNVVCATLCIGTVNALTQEKFGPVESAKRERILFETAIRGLVNLD